MSINVGAFIDGARPRSKKALKEALTQDPTSVSFDGTSGFGPAFDGDITQLPAGAKLQVTGPCPYTKRNWYATVELVGGNVKVS